MTGVEVESWPCGLRFELGWWDMSEGKGLIIVYTGNGKGKTTAALGAALRAASRGMKTLMMQFLKEKGASAEQGIPPSLSEYITVYPCGKGFVFDGDDIAPHKEAAEAGWRFMEEELKRNKYDILILDEVAAALNLHLLSTENIMNCLSRKAAALHVILTGRDMPEELIGIADTVTEMKEIKHAYQKGIDATPGIDY
jgi:cob(I)alamin adenosyltransferase